MKPSPKRKLSPNSRPKQKAARGLHEVTVPPTGNGGDVLNSALQGGMAGSQFGPIGGALGALGGLGMGLFQSSQADKANREALAHNQYVKANEAVEGVDPTLTQRGLYKEGTGEVKTGPGKKGKLKAYTPTRQDSLDLYQQGLPLKSYFGIPRDQVEADGKKALQEYPTSPSPWAKGIAPTGYRVEPNQNGYNLALSFPAPKGAAPYIPPVPTLTLPPEQVAMTKPHVSAKSRGGYSDRAPGRGFAPSEYAQGSQGVDTKPIEVEKDELIFRKVGDRFRLKADFQKGKPHSQGGEDYLAQEGDIIFPGKQRGKVLEAYKGGQHSKLEGMRLKLPKDTNPQGKAASGADLLDPDKPTQYLPSRLAPGQWNANQANRYGAYGAFPQAQAGLATGQSEFLAQDPLGNFQGPVVAYQDPRNKAGQRSYYQSTLPQPMAPRNLLEGGVGNSSIPSSVASIRLAPNNSTPPSPSAVTEQETGQGGGYGNILKYASVANNLIQGFSSPEKVQESYLDPSLQTYTDRSDPQRRQSTMTRNAQFANARGASGGLVGNLRANQQIAQAEDFSRKQGIDNREQELADQVRASNTQEVGRVKTANLGLKNQYAALNGQARANQQAYKDAAFGQLSSLGNAKEQEGYIRSRDSKLDARDQTALGYLNQLTHYQTNGKGEIVWNPNGSGYSTTNPVTQTTTVDSTGKRKVTTKRKLR